MAVLCGTCKENNSKYKCSNCYSPYCSPNCWKKHKNEEQCATPVEVPKDIQVASSNNKTKYFTEDTIKEEKLMQLGGSKALKKILSKKYLQATLTAIDNASNPEETLKLAMQDPEFVEFVDECLKIVEDPNE